MLIMIALLSFFCYISVRFIQGIHEVNYTVTFLPLISFDCEYYSQRDVSKTKHFMWMTAVIAVFSGLQGIFNLSFLYIILGVINCYIFIVIYSVYQILLFEGLQKNNQDFAFKSASVQNAPSAPMENLVSQNTASQGYAYNYTQDNYGQRNNDVGNLGYQTAQGP